VNLDPKTEIREISPVFDEEGPEDGQTQESRHLQYAQRRAKTRARSPVFQETQMNPQNNPFKERQDHMTFTIEYEQEEDGRWLAEVKEMPGVIAYGGDPDEAVAHAQILALKAVIQRIEHGESIPE
jgi:predicted RNase H-like HicB family nuclease